MFKTTLSELCTTTNQDGSIDEQAQELTYILIKAEECTIPKSKPNKKKRQYWCYNDEGK